jgi:hypothetical protein
MHQINVMALLLLNVSSFSSNNKNPDLEKAMSPKPMSKNRFVPSVESLERRELMSVTSVTLNAAGALIVKCDGGNNNVQISTPTPVMSMSSMVAPTTSYGPVAPTAAKVNVGGTSQVTSVFNSLVVTDLTKTSNNVWTFSKSAVKSIEIDAGNGNNSIYSSAAINTTVNVGNGNNIIQTGAGNDIVFAGNGNNQITTNDGDDIVYVGTGNNLVFTGAGNDSIIAQGGNNQLFGGAGSDHITNFLNPAQPNNVSLIYGQDDNDFITSTDRNDFIDGGAGYDTIAVQGGTNVRNGEKVTISVPLGNSAADYGKFSAVACANRVLQSEGFGALPNGTILNDSDYGLTPDQLAYDMTRIKSNTTLQTGASINNLISVVQSGKPVLIPICRTGNVSGYKTWAVVNGYDSLTQTFQIVEGGVQMSLTFAQLNVQWSYPGFGAANSQKNAMIY